jgi:hypothetical protein
MHSIVQVAQLALADRTVDLCSARFSKTGTHLHTPNTDKAAKKTILLFFFNIFLYCRCLQLDGIDFPIRTPQKNSEKNN